MRTVIVGGGVVGGAMLRYYKEHTDHGAVLYDPPQGHTDKRVFIGADAAMLCVPTPFRDGAFDCSIVEACLNVIPVNVPVVLRSTVQPGTTARLQREYAARRFLYVPEFLTESSAYNDEVSPARVIVGYTEQSRGLVAMVTDLLPCAAYVRAMPATDAEAVKYFSNSFYAVKVSFANQFYDLCVRLGVDYDRVRQCAQHDPMIASQHLDVHHAGYRGFGGKCLPKDAAALLALADAVGIDLSVLHAACDYNEVLTGASPTETPLRPTGAARVRRLSDDTSCREST